MHLTVPRVIRGWAAGRVITPANFGFVDNGHGRRYATERSDPNWLDAFAEFGLIPTMVEPVYGIFTGVHYLNDACTHPHTDPAPEGFAHVRCNVLIRKPISGGDPVVDGVLMRVEEGDLWLVFASLEVHSSTPIHGSKRVIKSFGGLVPLEQVSPLISTNGA